VLALRAGAGGPVLGTSLCDRGGVIISRRRLAAFVVGDPGRRAPLPRKLPQRLTGA
jgi:hypothetical protein